MKVSEFERTILSQYATSKKVVELLRKFNEFIDPEVDIDNFYDKVFNLDTCETYGLDVWGIIVAAPRIVRIESSDYFGFRGTTFKPFNQAPFFNGVNAPSNFRLADEAYRQMIYFKAMVNIMNTAIPDMNKVLYSFFQRMGRPPSTEVYTQRTGVMTMRVVFRFILTEVERAIFRTYGSLIRPGGVGITYHEIPLETFGFNGTELRPFNVGTFYSGVSWQLESIG